jgi:hypothetical protein
MQRRGGDEQEEAVRKRRGGVGDPRQLALGIF